MSGFTQTGKEKCMDKFVPEADARHVVEHYHGNQYKIGKRINTLAELFSKPDGTTHALIGHMSISHEILEALPPGEYRNEFEHGYAYWGTYINQ